MPVVVRFSAHGQGTAPPSSRPWPSPPTSRSSAAWSWTSDAEVHFRPKEVLAGVQRRQLDVDLKGVRRRARRLGDGNRTVKFRTGSSMVSVVDVEGHNLTVYRNGKKARDAGQHRQGRVPDPQRHQGDPREAPAQGHGRQGRSVSPRGTRSTTASTCRTRCGSRGPASSSTRRRGRPAAGPGQRQPRLRGHEHVERDLAVQPDARSGTSSRSWGSPRTLEPVNGYTDWNVSWGGLDWPAAPSEPPGPPGSASPGGEGGSSEGRAPPSLWPSSPVTCGSTTTRSWPRRGRRGRRRLPAVRPRRRHPGARPTTGPTGRTSWPTRSATSTGSLSGAGRRTRGPPRGVGRGGRPGGRRRPGADVVHVAGDVSRYAAQRLDRLRSARRSGSGSRSTTTRCWWCRPARSRRAARTTWRCSRPTTGSGSGSRCGSPAPTPQSLPMPTGQHGAGCPADDIAGRGSRRRRSPAGERPGETADARLAAQPASTAYDRRPRRARQRQHLPPLALPALRLSLAGGAGAAGPRAPGGGVGAFVRQIAWRDFHHQVLAAHPEATARTTGRAVTAGTAARKSSRRGRRAGPATRSSTPGCASSRAKGGCTTGRGSSSATSCARRSGSTGGGGAALRRPAARRRRREQHDELAVGRRGPARTAATTGRTTWCCRRAGTTPGAPTYAGTSRSWPAGRRVRARAVAVPGGRVREQLGYPRPIVDQDEAKNRSARPPATEAAPAVAA